MIRFLQAVDCFPKRVAKSTYFIFSSLTLFVSKQALVGYTDENWKSNIKNHELNFNHFLPFLKDLDKSSPHFLTWYLCAFKTDFTGLTENRISIGSQQSHNIPNGEGHQRISAVNKKIRNLDGKSYPWKPENMQIGWFWIRNQYTLQICPLFVLPKCQYVPF